MPFDQKFPRSFLAGAVREFAPQQSGVYGISNASEWIFIGETDDIQATLFGHLQETGTNLERRHPTGFVFELCGRAGRTNRQDRLIREYEPTCNRHVSRHI
ncbi:MAG: hypothetical protein ABI972_02315 [Acidobacteriota bacterium]